MAFENLLVETKGAVRVISVNRPAALNALNHKTVTELQAAFADVAADGSIRAVVVTGAGEKSFVAGADIKEFSALTPDDARGYAALGHRVLGSIANANVPVIAAVNGFALGGGLELALACDFIYAADTARLGLVETNLGIMPGFGGCARLARRVGTARAKEMIFSAVQVKADEALRIGLVNKVVPAAELMTEALKTAESMASKGPKAVQATKRLLNLVDDDGAVHALEQESFGVLFSTADKTEGVAAFVEKRKAQFAGK